MVIGLVSTAYFGGLMIGALKAGNIVRRVGHIRACRLRGPAVGEHPLTYALLQNSLLWATLRLVDGLCVAGVFICVESWLNERAETGTRGSILAWYMVTLYSGQAVGQALFRIGGTAQDVPFQFASTLITLAIIPVCLTRSAAPMLEDAASLPLRRLFEASPLGVAGTHGLHAGLVLGAFYGLAAIYARRLGLSLGDIATFMMTIILGGVALQWPLGRLSDLYDRRCVIIACFTATLAVSVALAMLPDGALLLALGAGFGGLSVALYPLCVAYVNDRLLPTECVAASGQLVLLYSSGAALDPIGAATSMTLAGPGGLFLFIAACATVMLVFGLWRLATSDPVPGAARQDFQILPRTTPVAALLDPAGSDTPAPLSGPKIQTGDRWTNQ